MDEFKDVYSVVHIYDPTVEGNVRQMMVECYRGNGRDVTAKVVAEHTRLLLDVAAINRTLAIIGDGQSSKMHEFTVDNLKHHYLRRAQSQLELFEAHFAGIENYRNYRTPFK
ncbi:hypothetical protein P5_0026 [Aeromonas phage P5]|nr:hypothetical protein P5_0026 [Aeromonas phage P5]